MILYFSSKFISKIGFFLLNKRNHFSTLESNLSNRRNSFFYYDHNFLCHSKNIISIISCLLSCFCQSSPIITAINFLYSLRKEINKKSKLKMCMISNNNLFKLHFWQLKCEMLLLKNTYKVLPLGAYILFLLYTQETWSSSSHWKCQSARNKSVKEMNEWNWQPIRTSRHSFIYQNIKNTEPFIFWKETEESGFYC